MLCAPKFSPHNLKALVASCTIRDTDAQQSMRRLSRYIGQSDLNTLSYYEIVDFFENCCDVTPFNNNLLY